MKKRGIVKTFLKGYRLGRAYGASRRKALRMAWRNMWPRRDDASLVTAAGIKWSGAMLDLDADPGCPGTKGGDANGVGAVRCGRPTTYRCNHAPDTCEFHKSSCCTLKSGFIVR